MEHQKRRDVPAVFWELSGPTGSGCVAGLQQPPMPWRCAECWPASWCGRRHRTSRRVRRTLRNLPLSSFYSGTPHNSLPPVIYLQFPVYIDPPSTRVAAVPSEPATSITHHLPGMTSPSHTHRPAPASTYRHAQRPPLESLIVAMISVKLCAFLSICEKVVFFAFSFNGHTSV